MNHVVYCDAQAKEMDKLISGVQTMLIHSATGRKVPHAAGSRPAIGCISSTTTQKAL